MKILTEDRFHELLDCWTCCMNLDSKQTRSPTTECPFNRIQVLKGKPKTVNRIGKTKKFGVENYCVQDKDLFMGYIGKSNKRTLSVLCCTNLKFVMMLVHWTTGLTSHDLPD